MIVGSLFDQKKQNSQSGTSSGIIKPLISTSSPTLQKQASQQTSQPEVKTSQPKKIAEKATNFIASLKLDQVSLKKIGKSFIEGAKMIPSQVKQGSGIIIQAIASQQKVLDNFYQKTPKAVQNVLGNTPIFQASKLKATFPKVTEKVNKKVEDVALNLREKGFQESKQKKEEYAKTYQPSEGLQKYLEMVSFNLPQVATSVALTTGTALLTKNPALATTVGLSTSYGMGASEVYDEARSNGLSDKESLPLAQFGGVVIGALDFIPLEKLIRKTGATKIIEKSIIKKISKALVSLGVQAGFEGVTEGAQEIVGNAISSTYNENQDLFEGVKESVIVGALLGGMSDLTIEAVTGITGKSAENIQTKISEAISTPKEDRTEEQEKIVETLFTQEMTSDQLINYVTENKLQDTEEGRSLVKTAYQAQQSGQNVKLSLSEDEKSLDAELISKQYVAPVKETSEKEQKYDYQSTQLDLPKEQAKTISDFANKIPEEELYTEEGDNTYGREENPHVTVLYGLENADTTKLKKVVESFDPIEVETKDISIFEDKEGRYDVLKVDVEGKALRDLNKKISENFDTPGATFKDYKPHITIAYVKKGMGQKYIDGKALSGKKIKIDKLSFNDRSGETIEIGLLGKESIDVETESTKIETPKVLKELSKKKIENAKTIRDVTRLVKKIRSEFEQLITEAEGKAEFAKEQREGLNTKKIAKLRTIYNRTKSFQEGDIDTIRKSKHRELLNDVIEGVQKKYPDKSEQEAFDFAMELPTKAEEKVLKPEEMKILKEKEKKLSLYLETLKQKQESLNLKESEALSEEWSKVLASQEKLSKIIEVPRKQLPQGEGEKKLSRLEARVNKFVDKVTEDQIERLGLASYNQLSKKENIEKAVAYVSANPEEAMQVLAGQREAPQGILHNAIYIAMEQLAQGDLNLARRLASLSSTRMGQEISILTEVDPDSTVRLMRDIISVREEVFKRKFSGKTATEAKAKVVSEIEAQIKKPDKVQWNEFLNEIKC